MSRAKQIVAIAKSYVGILEIKPNKGFGNKEFEKKMKAVGFYVGAPWCAFFTKLVFKEAYTDHKGMSAVINSCASGGAQLTLKNFKANGTFSVDTEPKVGALVIWQMGDGTSGHAGIVTAVDVATNTMKTVEGNTNASGSREGDRVAEKWRTITRPRKTDGLNIIGYIYPFEV